MIFLGCLFNKKDEVEILRNSKQGLPNSVNYLQWRLIDGFIANNEHVEIVYVLPVGTYPSAYSKILLNDKEWKYNNCKCKEIGTINLPLLKQFFRYRKVKKIISKSCEKNIIIYSMYKPYLKAIKKLDDSYKVTLIVADLPEYYDFKKVNVFRKILRRIYNIGIYKYIKRVDNFVLLTEQMKDKLNVGNRNYVVVEGVSDVCNLEVTKSITNDTKKVIFYSGSLSKRLGILNLLDAFDMLCYDSKDYELWICGSGEAKDEILKRAYLNKNIIYYGYLPKNEVIKLQRRATVLINPRMNNEEYTKYSFPSKVIEYLNSGVPVIMYRLDGIPREYDDYVYYVDGSTVIDLKNKIIEICSKDNDRLAEFGFRAKKWIMNEKNYIIQSKKIIDMIKK